MYYLLLSILVGLQLFDVSYGACKNGIPIIPKLTTTTTTSTTTTTPTTTTTTTPTTTTTTTTTTTPAPTTTTTTLAPTTTTTTPAPLACSLCGNLPFAPPPQGYMTVQSAGIITPSTNAAGCKQYLVTCYAYGASYIVIGANQQFISLSPSALGDKYALLTCNNLGQIIGLGYPYNNPFVVTSVYCARSL